MPHIRTIPRRWRARCALTGVLTAVAVLCGMLPAGASNGLNWTTLPSLPTARFQLGSAAAPCPRGQTGTCLYSVGGSDGSSVLNTVQSYNRTSNAWSTLPVLPTARRALAAAAAPCPAGQSGTCVYAIGGVSGSGYSRTVQSYNPATNSWTALASLGTARSYLGAAAAPCPAGQTGTCVYAIGGFNTSGNLASVEAYNPATKSWSIVASLSAARSGQGAAAAPCPNGQGGTCVYAAGGLDPAVSDTVESYNPATKAWSLVASLTVARDTPGVAATTCPPGQSGICVYAVGGISGTTPLGTTESYNPASDVWTSLPSLPTPRFQAGAAALSCPPGATGNCVYIAGGDDGGGAVGTLEALDPPAVGH
ncbi:Kelch repeat-containing protein [Streptomyces sp. NPDC096132]|uniref:Kelch repeat-containing protein n=1 Tax=Streptomyces sp. NPDC096132 TaxID=3366075 RepID=UPI00381490A0